jgi:hypothetical protein
MKKFSLTAIPVLIAAVSSLSADSMGNRCSKNASTQTTTQPMHTITPSANPMVTDCCDPFITADFIWWKAEEDGLAFAYTGGAATDASASRGTVYQPKFKYEPGFKVGAGLKFKHDGWDLYANYTWLRANHRSKSVTAPGSSALFSNYFVQSVAATVDPIVIDGSASGKWKLHFNVVDLELGRNFWISQWLTLRPHFGLKGSWNHQKFGVSYTDVTTTIGGIGTVADYSLNFKQHQWAVGLRTGLDTAWYMWKKWCIYGEFAISAMCNHFNDKTSEVETSALLAGGSSTTLNSKRHSRPVTEVLELALGLRFETTFHNDDYLFMLQAGWEEQIWFNENQLFSPFTTSSQNLTLQGLTIKAGFEF